MSTFTTPDLRTGTLQALPIAKVGDLAGRTKHATLLSRFLAWYRLAVISPETVQEKAEWQHNSF
jgi:hypothetical protein